MSVLQIQIIQLGFELLALFDDHQVVSPMQLSLQC
jgi:hypothetical protein